MTPAQKALAELIDLAMVEAADLRQKMQTEAKIFGRTINEMRNPDGTFVGAQLLLAESNLILAATMLRSE